MEWVGVILMVICPNFWILGMLQFGRASAQDTGVVNLCVGVIISVLAIGMLFKAPPAWSEVSFLVLLWGMVYLTIYAVLFRGLEARGIGWYFIMAAAVCVWYAVDFAIKGFDVWFIFNVIAWAYILVVAWLVFGLGRPLIRLLAWTFVVEAVVTLFIPGMLLITTGKLPTPGIP